MRSTAMTCSCVLDDQNCDIVGKKGSVLQAQLEPNLLHRDPRTTKESPQKGQLAVQGRLGKHLEQPIGEDRKAGLRGQGQDAILVAGCG